MRILSLALCFQKVGWKRPRQVMISNSQVARPLTNPCVGQQAEVFIERPGADTGRRAKETT